MKKFLHIPLQSGSDSVLKKMNRKYKVRDFLKIIDKFKKEIPDISISTDIIVAFPGESEEDFEKSVEVIKKLKPNMLNLSKYWRMKGTQAAEMEQVPVGVAKQRSIKLMKIYKKNKIIS